MFKTTVKQYPFGGVCHYYESIHDFDSEMDSFPAYGVGREHFDDRIFTSLRNVLLVFKEISSSQGKSVGVIMKFV